MDDHPINQILRKYNEFLSLTFKNKSQYFEILSIHKAYKEIISLASSVARNKPFLDRPAANLSVKQMYEDGFHDKKFTVPLKEVLLNR